jgi:hypothetical protein
MAVERRFKKELPELNLIPVMNLVTILIPFLLLSVEFVHLAVIDSSLPAIGLPQEVDEDREEEENPLNLKVAITDRGFSVLGAAPVVEVPEAPEGAPAAGEEGEEVPPTIPMMEDEEACQDAICGEVVDCEAPTPCYDFQALRDLSLEIREHWDVDCNDPNPEFRTKCTVILVPESEVEYEWIVGAMDATRDASVENELGESETRPLFPYVVLAGGTR